MDKRKITIDELEKILNAPDSDQKVSVLPSGEIIVNDRIAELEGELAALRARLAEVEGGTRKCFPPT